MQERPKRSRLLLPVVLVTMAIILLVGVFEFQVGTNSGSGTSTAIASGQIGAAFSDHLQELESMNTSKMEGDYTSNATLSFVSMGEGDYYEPNSAHETSDNVTTPKEIGVFFQGTFLSDFALPHIYDQNTNVTVEGDRAQLTSTFTLSGTNIDDTNLIASVTCQVSYVNIDGQWLISHEVWILNNVNSH